MEMKKDNRTEFEKMEAGEMFWNFGRFIFWTNRHFVTPPIYLNLSELF